MKRKLVVAEIMVALALSLGLLAWMSGAVPRWMASLTAPTHTARPVGQYSIEVVGWGSFGRIHDINRTGQAAGAASTIEGVIYAAVWDDGETVPCYEIDGRLYSEAVAVGEDGTVALNVRELEGEDSRAYVMTPGQETVCLNDLLEGAARCRVADMNRSGRAVGAAELKSGEKLPFIWSAADGVSVLGDDSRMPLGISDHGVIVGLERSTAAGWTPSAWLPTLDDGYRSVYLNGNQKREGRAYAVNDQGEVVGRLAGPVPMRWDAASGIEVLPALTETFFAGWAHDINDLGDIVGCLTGFGGGRAVLWREGKAYDLNQHIPPSHGWHLVEATAINNEGVIACRTVFEDGIGVVLLRPRGV